MLIVFLLPKETLIRQLCWVNILHILYNWYLSYDYRCHLEFLTLKFNDTTKNGITDTKNIFKYFIFIYFNFHFPLNYV